MASLSFIQPMIRQNQLNRSIVGDGIVALAVVNGEGATRVLQLPRY